MSVPNDVLIVGSPSGNVPSSNQTSIGFIESPRYPDAYPRFLVKRYSLVNSQLNGYVRLIFDDFHVHFQSEMQIFDSDDRQIINTKNENRRPPAILSNGNRLTILFRAHNFTQTVGFRARYEFVDDPQWPDRPNSRGCDEFIEAYGGDIKLDGSHHLVNTFVDCIWIIGQAPHIARTFDRLYVKVEEFHVKGVGILLEIREGTTSTSNRVLLLFDSQTRDQLQHKQPRHGFITSSPTPAFYIRLRGYLMGTRGLEIVYAQFYRWGTSVCPGIGEYHCDNARCIKAILRCDGTDNCGDGSDEVCQRPISDFKQTDADVSGLIALVIGVCGLVLLIISTTAVMGRFYHRRVISQTGGTDISATAYRSDSTSAPSIQTVGERRFYVVPESQICVIEAPPSYDDALKHPSVQSSRPLAYMNRAYLSTTSEERVTQPSTPVSPTTPPESSLDLSSESFRTTDVQSEIPIIGNTSSAGQQSEEEKSITSDNSSSSRRQDDESWV
ncbi:Low-density lipoprotein receptor domain class A [Dictyocaulus viviparus]|uniref:Low-density lipoprotein receptor domain class A n=1 Tax=Dictyocaulus viviparus TaxID=29172 RepID=A0A0D8Y1G5_DICVI|nr:Low-density lipoprotein receptor domain class A [Dictyocaulus viviparus]